jgi:hypothetical protein
MNFRSGAIAIASLALGAALLGVLVKVSNLHLQEILSRFSAMDRLAFIRLTLLMALNAFLSSLKWRITDRAMRHTSDASLSQFESFVLSVMGSAFAQVLPAQFSMSVVRTLGTRMHGRAFQRGTLGTLFEQSFDVWFGCSLMIASVATYLWHGELATWLATSVLVAVVAIAAAGIILRFLRRVASKALTDDANAVGWRRFVMKLSNSALLEPALGRKLIFLSGLRFIIFVLMAGETSAAIHSAVPLWHLGMAMPFAVFSAAAGITPGGLGISEFTYAGVLRALGTPLTVSTQWALANRLLISAGYLILAAVLLPLFFVFRSGDADAPSESPTQ